MHFPFSTCLIFLLSHIVATSPNSLVSGYTILGGLDDEPSSDTEPNDGDGDDGDDPLIVTETLRHFAPPRNRVRLRVQTHEPTSGRVSMAGTLWEASPLLADYVTNPACPLEAFRRARRGRIDDGGDEEAPTVVELGSGVGLASLAAAFAGCRVHATDGSPSSIRLLEENFGRYADDCPFPPTASMMEWGDGDAADWLMNDILRGRPPDVVMASDVVYAHSAREELSRTVRRLCPVGHVGGRVLIAHRWRADPVDEESFFRSFDDEFDRGEVGLEFFPEGSYYRTRSMIDMKYPVSIFEMRRKR